MAACLTRRIMTCGKFSVFRWWRRRSGEPLSSLWKISGFVKKKSEICSLSLRWGDVKRKERKYETSQEFEDFMKNPFWVHSRVCSAVYFDCHAFVAVFHHFKIFKSFLLDFCCFTTTSHSSLFRLTFMGAHFTLPFLPMTCKMWETSRYDRSWHLIAFVVRRTTSYVNNPPPAKASPLRLIE